MSRTSTYPISANIHKKLIDIGFKSFRGDNMIYGDGGLDKYQVDDTYTYVLIDDGDADIYKTLGVTIYDKISSGGREKLDLSMNVSQFSDTDQYQEMLVNFQRLDKGLGEFIHFREHIDMTERPIQYMLQKGRGKREYDNIQTEDLEQFLWGLINNNFEEVKSNHEF